MPEVGVIQLADLFCALFYQHALFKIEQIRRLAAGLFPPAIKVTGGDGIDADALIVKFKQRIVIHQNVAAARLMLQLFNFGAQLQVLAEEGVPGLPIPLHQRMADKQLAAERRIDLAVVNLARGDHRQAVNGDLLCRHHRPLGALPVRLAVRALEQMLGHRLDPLGIDTRGDAPPQSTGLYQLGNHRPFWRFFKQARAGEDGETGVARAGKLLLVGILHTDMRQQAGKQRNMDLAVLCRLAVDRNTQLFHHLAQLGVDILPLAYPQIVEVVGTAETAELVRRQRFLLFAKVVPQVNKGEEVRLFVVEATMFLIGRLLLVHRPLTRILNRERGCDDHRFAHAAQLLRLQHHTGKTRIHRQLRQLTPLGGELVGGLVLIGGDGSQLLQQAHAILNVASVRRLHKRERRNVAQPERGHLQNHRRKVGAQDLWVGKLRPREEIVLGVEANTDPFGYATAAAFTLVGRCL